MARTKTTAGIIKGSGQYHLPGGTPPGPLTGEKATGVVVPIGWVLLQDVDHPNRTLLTELGDTFPTVKQGYGGWEEIDRPGRQSLTVWRGYKPFAIDLELWIDGLPTNSSCEVAIEALERLAGRASGQAVAQPPLLTVDTGGVLKHFNESSASRWVITDLTFDEDVTVVNGSGDRVRAAVTVGLLQYVNESTLADRSAAARKVIAGATKAKGSPYKARSGDTLVSIARNRLKDAGRWADIQKLNPDLRDPRAKIKPGRMVLMP